MSKKANAPLWVSQNFMTSKQDIQTLLRRTSLNRQDHVVEIGPGKGHITRCLAARCGKVTAVELDSRLYCLLKEKLQPLENVFLIHHDFLTWPLPKGRYKVFANIPFHLSTAIIRRLTEADNPPQEIWLITEYGCAMRFCGLPKESLRSLQLKTRFETGISQRISASAFHPKPQVDAALLHLTLKPQPDLPQTLQGEFLRFLSAALSSGGLRKLFTKKQLATAAKRAGLAPGFTTGDIRYIQWLCLFRCWRYFAGHGAG